MDKKIKLFLIIAGALALAGIILSFISIKLSQGEFNVDAVLLKSMIKQGEFSSNVVHITSFSSQDFKASVEGVNDLVSLSEQEFNIDAGQAKEIVVKLDAVNINVEPGVYTGRLVISSPKRTKAVPIILDIQSKDVLFAVNLDVSPEYKEVVRGDKVTVSVKSYNLYDTKTHPVEMDYVIKDLNGRDVSFERENVVVGTETVNTKTIIVPKDIEAGNYVFSVIARYDGSVGTSSYLFSVAGSKAIVSSDISGFNMNYFALIVLAFLFGIVVLVVYTIKDRNRQLAEFEKLHSEEMRLIVEHIEKRKNAGLCSAKSSHEKKRIARRFKEIKKKVVHAVKQRYKQRKTELAQLKKQNKKHEMKARLKQWKKQGFDVEALLTKVSKPSHKSIDKQIEEWKKQGYDVNVLSNRKV